ncbi:MAG TPA: type I pullulanase [Tissierellia bacterium]|nr:type I pullulanase [Tissierellia bacterium]
MINQPTRKLGASYSPSGTTYCVFSPDSDKMELVYFSSSLGDELSVHEMQRLADGCYCLSLPGDHAGSYYLYRVYRGEAIYEVTDPFGLGSAPNSTRSAVIDLSRTDPPGFRHHERPKLSYKDALICETHIRDFTVHPAAGFRHPGKFIGLSESRSLGGQAIGIDYLQSLGVTHLHLMPVQDFITVDETTSGGYNWGYDPELYFVLEGSYVTDLSDPHQRLYEFKQMVQAIHAKGMGVVMDVVYNHTYKAEDSNLHRLAPGYYHRMDEAGHFYNGSGVGNEIASERYVTQRLIIESLEFFVRECQVDGFRFDLLGLTDIDTTKRVVNRLRAIDPDILLYGEPWGGGPAGLLIDKMTLQGQQRGHEFALFNDIFRDALKGKNDDASLGYVQGNVLGRTGVVSGITGSIDFSDQIYGFTHYPYESINYHSSHDNLILYDKLKKSTQKDDEHIKRLTKLTFAILLLSFGLPFFHLGTEFMRTKQMLPNTYNQPDAINQIDWRLRVRHNDLVEFVRGLVKLRRRIGVFSVYTDQDIRDHLVFLYSPMIIAYALELNGGSEFKTVLIAHNPTPEEMVLPFEVGSGRLLVYDGEVLDRPYAGEDIAPFSTLVLGVTKED